MTAVDDENITITDGKSTMQIETKNFTRLLNLAYCITTHCAQGQTYDHPYSIYEFHRMDARLRYVALSRSTKKSFINIF